MPHFGDFSFFLSRPGVPVPQGHTTTAVFVATDEGFTTEGLKKSSLPLGGKERRLEAAGIEPASRDASATASTCVVGGLISPRRRPLDRLRRGQPDVVFVGEGTRPLLAHAVRCLRFQALADKGLKTGCLVRQPLPSDDWQVNVDPRCLARPPWNLGTPPAPHSPGRIQFAPGKIGWLLLLYDPNG